MKNSVKLKRKTRRLLIKNLIVFSVLIAVISVGVRSWFIATPRAYAEDFTAVVKVPEGLEIAIVAPGAGVNSSTTWYSDTVDFNASNFSFLSGLNLLPVTGDGKSFIKPPLIQSSTVAHPNTTVVWDTTSDDFKTTANVDYISFDLYMRCKSADKKTVLTTSTYYGPENVAEDYGSLTAGWSANTVVGACRMAVYDHTHNTNELLWIPAPQLYYDGINLQKSVSDRTNQYGLRYTDDSGTIQNIHTDGTFRHGFYSSNKTRTIYTPISGDSKSGVTYNSKLQASYNSSSPYTLPTQITLENLDISNNDNGTYYLNHVRINLWIEGEDPESRAAQVSGEFKCVLDIGLEDK